MKISYQWLIAASAVALGEGLASRIPQAAELWPVFLVAAGLVVLLGYGFARKYYRPLALALLGAALFFLSSVESERNYRESPWLRNTPRRTARAPTDPLRQELARRVSLGLDHAPEVQALNRAILLGIKSDIPGKLRSSFVESGTIHVFAISGLHVMIFAELMMISVALCFVPTRFQGLATLPLLWGYVMLIDMPPSAVRAALMASIYFLAPLFRRKSDGLIAWSAAFLIVHLIDPKQIIEVGSLFSFTVMLTLVFAVRVSRELPQTRTKTALLTFSAWAAGVPIAASVFGHVTPGGLIANLFIIPAAACSVVSGLLGIVLSFVSTTLAVHLNNLAALSTGAMITIAQAVADIPFADIEIPRWGFRDCALWYTALGLFLYFVKLRITDLRSREEFLSPR